MNDISKIINQLLICKEEEKQKFVNSIYDYKTNSFNETIIKEKDIKKEITNGINRKSSRYIQ